MIIARVAECQNLNSGSRRMNGLNSEPRDGVGSSSSGSVSRRSFDGSIFGVMNARKMFNR